MPWRRSRTFGDLYGGRVRRRNTDDIFERLHSLSPPGPLDQLPIVITENPSRDFVFPVEPDEVVARYRQRSADDVSGITHLWFRRVSPHRFDAGLPFTDLVWGSGVRVVVIHPWRADLMLRLSTDRPKPAALRRYERWTADLRHVDGWWWLAWEADAARDFMLEHLPTPPRAAHR